MSSKKLSSNAFLKTRFLQTLGSAASDVGLNPELLIALSGGVDSVVLLSLAAALNNQKPYSVRAVYIDHGLQEQSVAWGHHCAGLCESLSVDFECLKVEVDLQSGLSPEAAARDARYAALISTMRPGEYLCTAHHADDQAETLLLQLFRGAGVKGLASMPELCEFGCGYLFRPLLQISQTEIMDYAKQHKLVWCDDPSNADLRYDRNYLRQELLPKLEKRWPQVTQNISRSASHCAEALMLSRELAVQDSLSQVANQTSCNRKQMPLQLSVSLLLSLSVVRQKNLLRHWISSQGFQTPSTVQLQQLMGDLVEASEEGHGRVSFGDAEVARYQDNLYVAKRGTFDSLADFEYSWQQSNQPLNIDELGWQLDAETRENLKPYLGKPLIVRNRRGGERWRPVAAGQSTSVKSMLQQRRIPPWQRSRLLFVFHEDVLIDICGPDFEL